MKAVWEVANRLAWDERTVTEWLADADAHPVEVEDFLGTQDPTPKSNGDTAMPSMLGHKIGDESGRKQ